MVRSTKIPAVLDEDLAVFLADIGEMERVVAGKVRCLVCEATLNLDTIQLVVPVGRRVSYVCSSQPCLVKFATRGLDSETA